MQIELSNRQKEILRALVEEHICTAEPVGSNTISKSSSVGLSAASVRNTMAELEEMGLLLKPHTSAGRIPSDDGYQCYIEYLMAEPTIGEDERGAINAFLAGSRDIFETLDGMARVLAQLTHRLGIIVSPFGDSVRLFRINVNLLSATRVMLILTLTSGTIRSMILEMDSEIDGRRLAAVTSLINDRLSGLTLKEIRDTILDRLSDVRALRDTFLTRLVGSAESIFRYGLEERLHYHGTAELLDQPEFHDFAKIRSIINLVEDPTDLVNIISVYGPGMFSGIRISRAIDGVAIICGGYETERGRGIASIVGPPRMDYAKTIGILSYTCKSLSKVFG